MVVGDLATEVDVVVLGAGPGGYVAAIRAAQLGKEVVLVDPNPPGGTCLHEGCIPSKALLTAVSHLHTLHTLPEMGIYVGAPTVDLPRMQRWKEGVVGRLAKGVGQLLKKNGVIVVQGNGRFLKPDQIWVEGDDATHVFAFENAIIATGATPAPWPNLPFDKETVLTPMAAMRLESVPERVLVVGNDYIAAEMATIFAKLGVQVSLFLGEERALLCNFDPMAGRLVGQQLRKLGVKMVKELGEETAVTIVSNGIIPRTAELDLAVADVQTDADGFVMVDAQMRTSNPNIFAVGDLVARPKAGFLPLATLAIKQGKVAAETMGGEVAVFAPQAIPQVAWTDPEVAAVGLTKTGAEQLGYRVVSGRFPLGANGRSQTLNAAAGMILTVAEAETELLLGVTIIAPHASDLIGEAALAIEMGATLTDLTETLHPHPGLGEALLESAEATLQKAIHIFMS
ncbi:MAG: FAD-dependent oxidoreductase [Chloroflexota bacterium]